MTGSESIDEQAELINRLTTLIEVEAPHLVSRPMYGGLVWEQQPGVASTSVIGLFARRDHVTLEFTHGAKLPDPDRHLEGKGGERRHVKLHKLEDIETKKVRSFILLAVALT